MHYPVPDFTNGLAPLSIFIDHVLDTDEDDPIRMLFILDEFDELPIELLRRTEPATALFQSIRQISTKPKCGFLSVGGENIGQLMVLQGDCLNKFEAIGVDYLKRPEFSDLIREPEYYPTLFEAIIRGYRRHNPDIPTYNPTHIIGYYGLTWDYTVMKLLNCPIPGPKTGFPQIYRVPGCPAFCWLPTPGLLEESQLCTLNHNRESETTPTMPAAAPKTAKGLPVAQSHTTA